MMNGNRNVLTIWKSGYSHYARTMTIAMISLVVCVMIAGCGMLDTQTGPPTAYTDIEGNQVTIPSPSNLEKTAKNLEMVIRNDVNPIAQAADPLTGGTAGMITLGVLNIVSLVGNVLQRRRELQYKGVVTTIQRDTDTGIIPMMKTADMNTLNFARKLVGEG